MQFEASHDADAAEADRLYDEIKNSAVPIRSVLEPLARPIKARLETLFAKRIRDGVFDGKGLKFLFEGEWIDLDRDTFVRIETAFDPAMVREVWIMRSALPLNELLAWCARENVDAANCTDRLATPMTFDRSSCSPSEPNKKEKRGGPNPIYDHQAIKREVVAFWRRVGDDGFTSRNLQQNLRQVFPEPSAQQLRNICRPLMTEIKARRQRDRKCSLKGLVVEFAKTT